MFLIFISWFTISPIFKIYLSTKLQQFNEYKHFDLYYLQQNVGKICQPFSSDYGACRFLCLSEKFQLTTSLTNAIFAWFKELNDSTMNKARDAGGRRSDEWKYKDVVIFAFRFGKKGIRISEARAKIAREKVWPDRRLSNNSSPPSQFDVKMASLLKLANRLVLMYRLGLFFPVHYK